MSYHEYMNILDIVFPKMCAGCKREGEYICGSCRQKLVVPEPICPMCSKPSLDGWMHPRCTKRCGMERLIVGLPYRGVVQQCLKKVKYKSAWDILDFLYRLQTVDVRLQNCLITAVPMWREKERERGFNQADIVAEMVAENNKVPYLVTLERTRETKPMFGLKKKERRENVEGAFKITYQQTNKLTGKRVILVDDVWTTGSTMRECAKVLKQGGVESVWGLTLAR